MHASIAVYVMMVGGWVGPESDITIVPLKDDVFSQNSIQDAEWRERVKIVPLPRVPTIDDRPQAGQDNRVRDPYQPYPRTPTRQVGTSVVPSPPTPTGPDQPGTGYGQTGTGYGQGGSGYGQTGPGYGQTGTGYGPSGRTDPYANTSVPGRNPVNPGYTGGYGNAPVVPPTANVTPTANNFIGNNSVSNITNPYGLNNSNPMLNPSASGVSKPFNQYQPPSGYSPWQQLYTSPTNNGTVSPYINNVRPSLDQQNFNAHVSEQINGVQTLQRGYGAGAPGMEVPMGGNGLVNPNTFQNYGGYYPMMQNQNPYQYPNQ